MSFLTWLVKTWRELKPGWRYFLTGLAAICAVALFVHFVKGAL